MSPNYPGISQLSAVTNTSTFRIKTKAAMKGYENVDLTLQQDLLDNRKSRNSCKLTELADIALGNQQKLDYANRQAPRRDSLLSVNDLPKATTESSTSSKTIMHSSKINAAVEEHNKTNGFSGVTQKIVIPERPFKNIGLEEKEPINFQKPRTCSLSLLNSTAAELLPTGTLTTVVDVAPQENSLSSASFSDRDDFDFGSLSCDDDEDKQQPKPDAEECSSSNRGVKTPTNSNQFVANELLPLGISNSSNDSSTSCNSTKTFENKSLIMGRIFKNNTTKVPAAKTATKLKSVGVQKDPLPAKADLNQIFDELRGDVKPKAVTTTTGTNTSPLVPIIDVYQQKTASIETDNELKNKITSSAAPFLKIVPVDGRKVAKQTKNEVISSTTTAVEEDLNVPATKPKAKVGRKPKAKKAEEKKTEKRGRKKSDLSKLKNELGMSPKQIEQLMDEGQRKSKRRCATAKKFVETWSSDEYEEFLSTKDVIALIEEKEKQEQEKRKRKNSATITTTTTIEPNWNTEYSNNKSQKANDFVEEIPVAKKQRQEEQEAACFMPIENEYDFVLPAHPPTPTIPAGMATTNHKESKKESKKKKKRKQLQQQQMEEDMQEYIEPDIEPYEMPQYVPPMKENCGKKRKQKHQTDPSHEVYMQPATNYFTAPPTTLLHSMNSAFVSTSTNEQMPPPYVEKKHKSHKKKKDKEHRVHKEHNEHKEHKNSKNCSPHKVKKVVAQEVETIPIITTTTTTKKHRGRKRKSETKSNKKHSKHKREKYYWSSSSSSSSTASASASSDEADYFEKDEKLKRNNHVNQSDDEEENDNYQEQLQHQEYMSGGDHLQKHGWIVGDSHKKLVTLLAIAKGSKKNVKKKKSSKKKNFK